jgi:hypothetical protein
MTHCPGSHNRLPSTIVWRVNISILLIRYRSQRFAYLRHWHYCLFRQEAWQCPNGLVRKPERARTCLPSLKTKFNIFVLAVSTFITYLWNLHSLRLQEVIQQDPNHYLRQQQEVPRLKTRFQHVTCCFEHTRYLGWWPSCVVLAR